jgi:hemoglobin
LYQRLGGERIVEQAVDLFYDKVLADDRIKHFFDNVDTRRLREKQRDFLAYACGGSVTYDSDNLRETHRHLDLKEEHFAAVVGHLKETLEALGVADDLVQDVVAIANATRDDVLNL